MTAKKMTAPIPADGPSTKEGKPRRGRIERTQRTVRRIDGRVLLYGLLGIAVLLGGFFGLHAIMLDRNADVLLKHADAAEKQGDFQAAVGHLSRYLRLRPDDIDALEHLAALLRRSSNSTRDWTEVLATLEQVLRKEPDRHEARQTAIETAFKLRRFSDADKHLAILAERNPEVRAEPSMRLTAARTSAGLGDTREAISRYLELIEAEPALVSGYAELADLIVTKASELPLRDSIKIARVAKQDHSLLEIFPKKRGEATAQDVAARLLQRMIERGEPRGRAYLARAVFRSSRSDFSGASADVQQALQAGGTDLSETYQVAAAVELQRARAASNSGNPSEASQHRRAAREFAEKGLASPAPDPRLHLLMAEIEVQMQSERQRGTCWKPQKSICVAVSSGSPSRGRNCSQAISSAFSALSSRKCNSAGPSPTLSSTG
jgi:tetratricopeptide (TPR) repeat protein